MTTPVARKDYEYVRKGGANLFVAVEPLTGQPLIEATPNRKGPAVARMMAGVAAAHKGATTIHLIVDNQRRLLLTMRHIESLRLNVRLHP